MISDAQDNHLVCHDITQQHDMSRVNAHTMRAHRVLDFFVNRRSGRFNSEYLRSLDNVVGLSHKTIDT